MKKKLREKEIEAILKLWASKNYIKYGTAEQMLDDLKKHFVEEKPKIKQ